MLHLIGADEAKSAIKGYGKAIVNLYKGNPNGDASVAGGKLAQKANAAITALRRYVIRHGIDDLPKEHKAFGAWGFWPTPIPHASLNEVELILRMDRTLRLLKDYGGRSERTNDPRFHVGWQHLDQELEAAAACLPSFPPLPRLLRQVT